LYRLITGTKNWSSWSLRAYLALRATGAPFEETVVPLRRPDTRDAIRKFVASNRVPALIVEEDDRQFFVFDSLAICETLAERHPDARLWPADVAARAKARSFSAAMHSGFSALRETLPMEFARRLPTPALSAEVLRDIAEISGYWEEALGDGGARGEFLFGAFSIADCMYAPVASRFTTYGLPLPPALDQYCRRIMNLPAMQDWFAASRVEVEAGLPSVTA
jgi:glutathione S-transferase